MKTEKYYPLSIHEVKVIEGDKIRPRTNKEYFIEDGVEWRNFFKPSVYMLCAGEPLKEPKVILGLFLHLVNYNPQRLEYVINWLAYFFKYLIKSQVALTLIGNQGSGKGILFSIISKLFGEQYCITINDESLNSKYKAKIIQNKLFYNFDEATGKTAKKTDSFYKAIVTNSSMTAEAKNETIDKEIELHGQCLNTSNNPIPLSVDESDRRNTVFTTGNNLSKTNFLYFGSYAKLKAAIDAELEDFARYLKCYDVNISLANTALDTAEKRVIIDASKDNNIKDFHKAIIDLDVSYFSELEDTNLSLYISIYSNFKQAKIDRADITKAYNELFSRRNITAKELMSKLRELKPYNTFSIENVTHSGNKHYFNLRGK